MIFRQLLEWMDNAKHTEEIHLMDKVIVSMLINHPVVFFLADVFTGDVTLHLKQVTIFGMITFPRKCSQQSDKWWFAKIRELCYQYDLSHPLFRFCQPSTQQRFKPLIKSLIYWFHTAKEQESCCPSHFTLTSIYDTGPQDYQK